MTGANDLARMVPGFDFFQNMLKNAGAGLPNMGQWVAPTLNPEELDKRIQELKTVQFWLEQNARLLATTVQAMEVQKMTLSTLQTMNLPLADIRNALQLKPFEAAPARAEAPAPAPAPAPTPAAPAAKPAARTAAQPTESPPPAAVDPLQWWGALTQQFTELATKAVQDSAADATRNLAGAMPGPSGASAAGAPGKAAPRRAAAARKR
jgi:hypothetical protein